MQHISSRQSLQALTDELVAGTEGLDVSDIEQLGDELTGVAAALRANPVLRRLLSESSTETAGRVDLVRRLLQGKVAGRTLELVTDAVGREWATGADLAEAVERLGRTALFVSAERENRLDTVEDELFRFGRIVESEPGLSVVLDDPTADPQGRARLVEQLLQGRADGLTVRLLRGIATSTQAGSFSNRVRDLVAQAAERRQELVAQVTSAVELDESQQQRLSAALERLYGRAVAVHAEVDPALLGGLRIAVGDEVIDGSAAGRLAALGRRLR